MFSRFGKITLISLYILVVAACKSQASHVASLGDTKLEINWCPDDGTCDVKMLSNKSLIFKTDEFGIGYTELISGESDLVILEYVRNEIPNTADGHYIERVYFELPQNNELLNLHNEKLQEINLLFERLCYCKGQTGFYKITDGHFILEQISPTKFHLRLDFNIGDVPHILNHFDQMI